MTSCIDYCVLGNKSINLLCGLSTNQLFPVSFAEQDRHPSCDRHIFWKTWTLDITRGSGEEGSGRNL